MKAHRWMLALGALVLFAACGDDDTDTNDDNNNTVELSLSGTAVPHPLAALGGTAVTSYFDTMSIGIYDPNTVLTVGWTAPALAEGPLTGCADGACPWSFDAVDATNLTAGIMSVITDDRASDQKFVPTAMGIVSMADTNAAVAAGTGLSSLKAMVVTRDMVDAFAALLSAATATTMDGDALLARGFVVGMVLNETGAQGVVGATVSASVLSPFFPSAFTFYYFQSNGAGGLMLDQTATSAAGYAAFIALADATSGTSAALFGVTPPNGDTRTWVPRAAGNLAGGAFVSMLLATPPTP